MRNRSDTHMAPSAIAYHASRYIITINNAHSAAGSFARQSSRVGAHSAFSKRAWCCMAAMCAQGTATRAMGRRGRENDGAQGSVGEPYCTMYHYNAFHDYPGDLHCPQAPSPRGSPSRLEGRIARPSASRTELVCLQEVYSDMIEAASSTIGAWGRCT